MNFIYKVLTNKILNKIYQIIKAIQVSPIKMAIQSFQKHFDNLPMIHLQWRNKNYLPRTMYLCDIEKTEEKIVASE